MDKKYMIDLVPVSARELIEYCDSRCYVRFDKTSEAASWLRSCGHTVVENPKWNEVIDDGISEPV